MAEQVALLPSTLTPRMSHLLGRVSPGMIRSARYLLQPTKGQTQRLDHLLRQQRKLYNAALAERKDAWEKEQRSVTRFEQFSGLNGMAITTPDLAQYGVCVARGTLTRLDLAYQAFFRRCRAGDTPGQPRFKGRFRWDSVSYPDISGWKLDPNASRPYLQGVGQIRVKMHLALPGRPKTITVKREGRRWWVSVSCDQVEPKPLVPTGRHVGIDLGVSSLLTTSEGEHLANPRFTNRAAARLAVAQQDLARKKRGSKRRRKAIERVAAQHRKVASCRRDHAHQVSRRLIDSFDLVAHENLAIPNLRTCSVCGHCEAGNRLSQAVFRCLVCGYTAHADENAAVNILRGGLALRLSRQAGEVQREVTGLVA